MNLSGSVRNQAGSVYIEIEGTAAQLASFEKQVTSKAPKSAKIESIESIALSELTRPYSGFHIQTSDGFQRCGAIENCGPSEKRGASENSSALENSTALENSGTPANGQHLAGFPIDFGLCSACKADITNPQNRRFGYPFISCAECGPRFTITLDLPFDRANTSMNAFPPCSKCQEEYIDPSNRRFHAQTISCANCGPSVRLLDTNGNKLDTGQPFHVLSQALVNGGIVAIKSTGGFHLVCDAMNTSAVASLRALKHRPDKPFAVMVSDISAVNKWLNLDGQDEDLVQDPRAPIVLIPKNTKGILELEHLSPSCNDLGVMRPYNGIYQCLFDAALAQGQQCERSKRQQPHILAVTSANMHGEPIIECLESVLDTFANKTAYILDHELAIANPCDDSVIQGGHHPMVFRLGRGCAPQVISNSDKVSHSSNQLLGLGAQEKSTLSVSNGSSIWISPELGKLNSIKACERFEAQRVQFSKVSDNGSMAITCDLHPDFHSSGVGETMKKKGNLPLIRVQHHHAHVAAVLQEHDFTEAALGLALDGFGLGPKQQAWGGELFQINGNTRRQAPLQDQLCYYNTARLGHITQLKLPGGDVASRYPLRCAHSALRMLSSSTALARLQALETEPVWDSLYDNPNCPLTSSMGRWFDAVAAILGFKGKSSYEAQAAIYLEHLAAQSAAKPNPIGVVDVQAEELNLLPLIELVLAQENAQQAAWHFHAELADGLCRWLIKARANAAINTVALSGGCIQNRILRERLVDELQATGFQVLLPTNIPCNDAAISLGQIYIARHALAHLKESPCA
jgi:hydrogenase maturation protein HypF